MAVAAVALIASGIVPVVALSTVVTLIALVAAVVLWWQMYASPFTTASEKSRLIGFIPLFISGVLFFGIFQQQFTVLAIYSDLRLDRVVFGYELSAAWINSINPIFIIAFGALFSLMWTKLGDRQLRSAR